MMLSFLVPQLDPPIIGELASIDDLEKRAKQQVRKPRKY
jgi:hypothetical protein